MIPETPEIMKTCAYCRYRALSVSLPPCSDCIRSRGCSENKFELNITIRAYGERCYKQGRLDKEERTGLFDFAGDD